RVSSQPQRSQALGLGAHGQGLGFVVRHRLLAVLLTLHLLEFGASRVLLRVVRHVVSCSDRLYRDWSQTNNMKYEPTGIVTAVASSLPQQPRPASSWHRHASYTRNRRMT